MEPQARGVLQMLIKAVSERNGLGSDDPYEDPYVSADEWLTKSLGPLGKQESQRALAVQSHTLFPLVLLAVRRGLRRELEQLWPAVSHVRLTWFRPNTPADTLLWKCQKGKEYADSFAQPQSWKELQQIAFRDDRERLPRVLRDDVVFALAFMLAFPHRILLSLIKVVDDKLGIVQRPEQGHQIH